MESLLHQLVRSSKELVEYVVITLTGSLKQGKKILSFKCEIER